MREIMHNPSLAASRNDIPRTSTFMRNYNTFTNHSIQNLPKRILIVDDEPYNIRGLTVQISQMGIDGISHIIDKAFNGWEALNLVKQGNERDNDRYCYGLIFMDCSMPVMDGYKASDEIRNYARLNRLSQPCIIACTGHTEEEFIEKAWRHQMDEVVGKPT